MTKIRMETDDVLETAHLLDWTAGELYYMPPKIKNLANSISSVWEGGKASHYAAELRREAGILQREVINLQRLAIRVRNEVSEWENVDGTHNFQMTYSSLEIAPGLGSLSPADGNLPRGWLDNYRSQLKEIYSSEAGIAWTAIGLGGVFIPTWIGGGLQVFADLGGGYNDYMGWAISDWEKYDSFGQEIAATLYDSYFASVKTNILVTLDVAEIVIDTLDLIPGGYLVTTSVGLGLWTVGQSFGMAFDTALESNTAMKSKDVFVNWFGDAINNAAQLTDSSFDPYIDQIMTAEPAGHSGSW